MKDVRLPKTGGRAAERLVPFLKTLLPDTPVTVEFWDGSSYGPASSDCRILLRSPLALRRLLFAPGQLGLARAYVAGELDVRGDMLEVLTALGAALDQDWDSRLDFSIPERIRLLLSCAAVGVLGPPPPAPKEEVRPAGRLHSKRRDARAISHHYDVSNDFYRLVLDDSMTYSCAFFARPGMSLEEAQRAKYDLVCRKLGLRPGMRLLDVGCGWGGMVMHAAESYGVEAAGITLSREQADLAEKRIAERGLAGRVEIRLQDYRDVKDGPYDAISSIGMFEHVGLAQLHKYFDVMAGLLTGGGRMLNHAISSLAGTGRSNDKSFINRYVFPDGELHEVGTVVSAMQHHGLEVRDVESLREHYGRTLRTWVGNLDRNWEEAERLAGAARARIWRLYMAASALGFEAGTMSVHQVLGVKPDAGGKTYMPATRAGFVLPDGAPAAP